MSARREHKTGIQPCLTQAVDRATFERYDGQSNDREDLQCGRSFHSVFASIMPSASPRFGRHFADPEGHVPDTNRQGYAIQTTVKSVEESHVWEDASLHNPGPDGQRANETVDERPDSWRELYDKAAEPNEPHGHLEHHE